MNRRRLLVLLLGVMLAIGSFALAPVPVARGVVHGFRIQGNYALAYDGIVAWLLIYSDQDIRTGTTGTVSSSLGSEPYTDSGYSGGFYWVRFGYNFNDHVHTSFPLSGTFTWEITTSFGYMWATDTRTYPSPSGSSEWLVGDGNTLVEWQGAPPQPLSVSLSGSLTTQIGVPYTCTATASGGTAPYRYLFSIDWVTVIGGVNNYTAVYTGALTSSGTFIYTFTFVGEFLIRVTALDAEDAEATDTLDLNAGVNKPALWGQIYDIPDDDPDMTYINFKLFPSTVSQDNPPVANGAIQTQFYEITSPGTVEKGSVYYMLSPVLITALPNPLLIYVNYHDPVSGSDWSYVFSFNTTGWAANSGAASNGDTWTGAETPGAFAWLWDLLVKLFRYLFVPSSTDFSAQIAEGWILIASPVPTITPQYTIPFPNPDHLLAPTGDSVNIDFSVISTWTYYATVKALGQVFLYAILIFVVIGIVA